MYSKTANPFYKSDRWQKLRARVLKRDGYMCQIALRAGQRVPADTVHHIFPIEDYPEYKLKSWNLISVSRAAHNRLHDRDTNALAEEGIALLKETAELNGIPDPYGPRTILVIGMPGAGKTTYVKKQIGTGICYDLDYLAAALKLSTPEERGYTSMADPARRMANNMLKGFADGAHRFANRVYIIRSAPTEEEYHTIRPTHLVIARGGYGNGDLTDERRHSLAARIKHCEETARAEGIPVKEIGIDIC